MDVHSGQSGGGGGVLSRSRATSQSPSPSHSASASVSATSAHPLTTSTTTHPNPNKRKLPSSPHHLPPPHPHPPSHPLSLSNDDLDSLSARADSDPVSLSNSEDRSEEEEENSEEEEEENSEEEEEEMEDDEEDDDSMRTFTNARLSSKPKGEVGSSGIEKVSELGVKEEREKDRGSNQVAGSGLAVKDDSVKSVFTDNIQTSGAYCAREDSLKKEEDAGRLKFVCFANDGVDEHMIWLIGLKNIFARQLPNMPKEYIVRLVMDRSHKSVMIIKNNQVVGGITYRPYVGQKFGEIAFCAIATDEQVKGYGTRLMNHLKQHARDVDGLTHFLTYADNNAVGYFIKQGFSKEIELERERWQGYIKDYDGGILMECKIDPKLPYTDLSAMIRQQRQAIDEKIRELSNCHIIYPGIDFQKKEAGISRKKVEDIPGLREAGWTPDQWGHTRFRAFSPAEIPNHRQQLNSFMRSLHKVLSEHADAWPFKEPVDARDVPDYYDVIKDPMDLRTMSKRLESEQYYVTFEMFVADVKRMFANARTYNSPDTIYYKLANRLESFFSNKVQAWLQASTKGQQ
ncbi:hypothetical protein AMTRI_Chr03g147880 [Amborella trichopoda]|uniref:histone acetyltransferase n=1 Tax=Amborella trichopoda TaxID=13333 RepID=W1P3C7_AMBTC|nr:histone acetyltransferase GCN5 [Amborella trichopoda]ERN01460.1 hypothetical protein AMTR_s00002p00268390 [Amborella trichopoda]|eukprot:XP_020519992.1 histone acetyltransferase GCN5 [Amborella trichopoda]